MHKYKTIRILIFVWICFISSFESHAQYTWKNASIGGGFVTGIITHPTSGDRYCWTDVGGAYRWDVKNNKWVQLLDWLNESESGFYGVEALALDPQKTASASLDAGGTVQFGSQPTKKEHGTGAVRTNSTLLCVK